MKWGAEYIGLMLLIVGVLLAYRRKKRFFDRTSQFGIEQFSSFRAKLATKMKDVALGCASLISLSAGLFILAFRYADSWGWVVLLPVYAFLLFLMLGT